MEMNDYVEKFDIKQELFLGGGYPQALSILYHLICYGSFKMEDALSMIG